MLYAALTFWLLIIVFTAWGVHRLWCGMVKPRVINALLLPGTLVAQLGHVLGLLVTGNSVRNLALMGDDEQGDPKSETPETTRIPVLGSILVGLLPLVACAVGLSFVNKYLGAAVLGDPIVAGLAVTQNLPATLAGFWTLPHAALDLMEKVLGAILHSNLLFWKTALFLYLAVCLTVRMAPFKGNRRGALAAILLAGLVITILASLTARAGEFILSNWPVLSFTVGLLLLLLALSLLINGIVGLVRILARNE